jgi:hypothetical protein
MSKAICIFYHCLDLAAGEIRSINNIEVFTIREGKDISDVITSDRNRNTYLPANGFNITGSVPAVNESKTLPDLVVLKDCVVDWLVNAPANSAADDRISSSLWTASLRTNILAYTGTSAQPQANKVNHLSTRLDVSFWGTASGANGGRYKLFIDDDVAGANRVSCKGFIKGSCEAVDDAPGQPLIDTHKNTIIREFSEETRITTFDIAKFIHRNTINNGNLYIYTYECSVAEKTLLLEHTSFSNPVVDARKLRRDIGFGKFETIHGLDTSQFNRVSRDTFNHFRDPFKCVPLCGGLAPSALAPAVAVHVSASGASGTSGASNSSSSSSSYRSFGAYSSSGAFASLNNRKSFGRFRLIGGYKEKYLKYKQKYILLKKELNIN